ncbi:MAG: MipA/OmpV family protein [Oligoflexia bacterium]|nr:MipA/OmpV family protein [Oligoflexia bacterium]
MKRLLISLFLLFLFTQPSYAGKFITGVGYLYPEKYRRDNEINPLPFGLSIVPMIAYRGERFSIFGPRMSYLVVKGLASLSLNVNIAGDRYKANILEQRDTAIHTGLSFRIPFLSVRYEQDVSSTHNGNLIRLTLRAPFKVSEKLFLRTSLSQEFVSEKFSKYYYRVDYQEVGLFDYYNPGSEQNIIFNLNATYSLDESSSLNLNWSHKRFGSEIANSPTIRLKNYNTIGFFWNYAI